MTSPVRLPDDPSLITKRGVSRIISEEQFVAMLNGGKPLRLKMGFAPAVPTSTLATWWDFASCVSCRIWGIR